jgi:hypothetical protein
MINMALTNNLPKTSPSHKKRRVMGRLTRTLESGVISTKSPGTTIIKSLVVEIKYKEINLDSQNNGRRQIIDTNLTTSVESENASLDRFFSACPQ